MPTDTASQTLEVHAPLDRVLAVIRDVQTQPEWVKEVLTVDVLEKNDDGTPATAHFTASAPVGKDEYTLAFTHRDDGMSWSLVQGRLQTGQNAAYTLHKAGKGGKAATTVTFDLTISHNLPLPGFIRRRVINGLVESNVTGLKAYLEA